MSGSNYCFSAYRFLRRQIRWSGIPISLRIFHTLLLTCTPKGFSIVNEADVFLEFSSFFYDSPDVGNLISSAFSKSSLYIQKFSIHILLKPSLKDFEQYIASMWNEYNHAVAWTFLTLPFFTIRMKTDLFQSCGHCWVFQICWCIKCSTLTALSFRIWNAWLEFYHLN